jgi:hypothetical protein
MALASRLAAGLLRRAGAATPAGAAAAASSSCRRSFSSVDDSKVIEHEVRFFGARLRANMRV